MKGAPLWFAGVVIGGWSVGRSFALWPAALPPRFVDTAVAATPSRAVPIMEAPPPRTEASGPSGSIDASGQPEQRRVARALDVTGRPSQPGSPSLGDARTTGVTQTSAVPTAPAEGVVARLSPSARVQRASPALADTAVPVIPSSGSRLHGDAWLVARPDGGDNLAFGQLGASQAGVRLTYAVDTGRRVALSARVSAPLRGRGREAAAGVDWQPLTAPLHLLVEARVPLDGGPALPAAQLIGGGAASLPLGWQIEGYAQAGAVRRRGAFADGSARVSHRLLGRGRTQLHLGGGAWGAAQRGVSRVDVGPTAGLSLPVGPAAVRLGLDYRLRVAGRARPGSGPAVTLGGSF